MASRHLHGTHFDVEQSESLLDVLFGRVIVATDNCLRLGPSLVSALMARQHEHLQSAQALVVALKVTLSSVPGSRLTTLVYVHVPLLRQPLESPDDRLY